MSNLTDKLYKEEFSLICNYRNIQRERTSLFILKTRLLSRLSTQKKETDIPTLTYGKGF